jgi:type II secretory pathway component PulF
MEWFLRLFWVPLWSVLFARTRAAQEASLLWTLAVGVEKGLPLVALLEAIADESQGNWRIKVRAIAELLDSGLAVGDALEAMPDLFSADTMALIRVGASSGQLAGALKEAALVTRKRMDSTVLNAHFTLAYLSVVWIWLSVVAVFIMYFIVPKYRAIFEGFGVPLPGLTDVVFKFSQVGSEVWFLLAAGVPFGVFLLWMMIGFATSLLGLGPIWRRNPLNSLIYWRPRWKAPGLMRCLAVCVDGKRPLAQAWETLAGSHRDQGFRRRIMQVQASLERGADNWYAMWAEGILRRGEVALLEAAERAGNLPWALRALADRIERRIDFRVQAAFQLLDPVLFLATGAVVGVFCAALFSPVIEVIQKGF